MRAIILSAITLICLLPMLNFNGFGGGMGGGSGPPAVQLETSELDSLRSNVIDNDNLIKLTSPGLDDVYLRPQRDSFKPRSISTQSLKTGDTTVFYSPEPVEVLQRNLAVTTAKNFALTLAPGLLPVTAEDIAFKPKPKAEIVSRVDVPLDWSNLESKISE